MCACVCAVRVCVCVRVDTHHFLFSLPHHLPDTHHLPAERCIPVSDDRMRVASRYSVCVCVCLRERERERDDAHLSEVTCVSACVCAWEREGVCMCVREDIRVSR